MSVEGGSAGGGVAGAASVSGAAILGPSFEAAPVVVNEGPFRGSLEGFRLMNTSDINTIDFKGGTIAPSQPSVIQQAEAVAAAAWNAPQLNEADAISEAQSIIAQNKKPALEPQPQVVPIISPITSTIVEDNVFLAANPLLEPVAKTELSPKSEKSVSKEKRVSYQIARAVSPQPMPQEQVAEEEVLEKVEQVVPENSLEEEEEIEKTNKKFVVDERALSQVVLEIKEAVRKAGVLAGKLGIKITGELIGKFLPGQHQGNESEAVKGKGPDGSIPERQQTIEEQGEYISDVQAEENAVLVAYAQPPIKIRPEGESVTPEVVEIVFRDHVAKPKAVAVEIYTKRIVKKQVQVLTGPAVAETKPETETSLADYPELAEVFDKAATPIH